MTQTGLIIAAGAGSRLADEREIPKPLRCVCGLTLLRRIILLSEKAGLKKMFIVVGFEKEKIIDYVRKNPWPLQIEFIENPEWQKSNGVSVLMAKDHIKENFVLLMADHIFEVSTLAKFRATPLGSFSASLAVDYKIDQIFDMDDATKVEVQNGKIKSIAKELVQFNAIDTGMFLMSPKIFTSLEAAKNAKGDCSLSDGVRALAVKDEMGTFDIGAGYWQDVDTPEGRAQAEKVLLQACRKDTDGFVSRNLNRYISLMISKRLVHTPLSPNQVTYLVFFLTGVSSAYFASRGTYGDFLIGAILFKLSSILDGVDGEMAKLKIAYSKMGQWLDTICDNLTYLLYFIGTIIGVNKRFPSDFITSISCLTMFGLVMVLVVSFYTLIKNTDSGSMLAIQQEFHKNAQSSPLKKLFAKFQFAIKRDFFALLVLFLAIIDKPHWILIGTALVTNIGWVVILQSRARMSQAQA